MLLNDKQGLVGFLLVYTGRNVRFLQACRALLYTIESQRDNFRGTSESSPSQISSRILCIFPFFLFYVTNTNLYIHTYHDM